MEVVTDPRDGVKKIQLTLMRGSAHKNISGERRDRDDDDKAEERSRVQAREKISRTEVVDLTFRTCCVRAREHSRGGCDFIYFFSRAW